MALNLFKNNCKGKFNAKNNFIIFLNLRSLILYHIIIKIFIQKLSKFFNLFILHNIRILIYQNIKIYKNNLFINIMIYISYT